MADAVNLQDYNGNSLVVTAWTLLGLTYFSVGLRTYVRTVFTHNFQADDWLMLVSLVCSSSCFSCRALGAGKLTKNAQAVFTLTCAFILIGVKDGIGFHNKAVQLDRQIEALKVRTRACPRFDHRMESPHAYKNTCSGKHWLPPRMS